MGTGSGRLADARSREHPPGFSPCRESTLSAGVSLHRVKPRSGCSLCNQDLLRFIERASAQPSYGKTLSRWEGWGGRGSQGDQTQNTKIFAELTHGRWLGRRVVATTGSRDGVIGFAQLISAGRFWSGAHDEVHKSSRGPPQR